MADDDTEAQITAANDMIDRVAAGIPAFPGRQTPAEIAAMARVAGFGPVPERVEITYAVAPAKCRVCWGSHGCQHPRGHDPGIPHECDCCECEKQPHDPGCVAGPPYYGKHTLYYGEDAEALGLPGANDD